MNSIAFGMEFHLDTDTHFSPLMAAKATFALKPVLCVRRIRFVM